MYKHEITAFLGNAAAATQFGLPASEAGGKSVKMLRTPSPLNPESLASFPSRLISDRANPYFKPLGYNRLKQGLETFANTPCSRRDQRNAAACVPGRQRPQLHRSTRPPWPPTPRTSTTGSSPTRSAASQHGQRPGPAVRQAGQVQVDRQVP